MRRLAHIGIGILAAVLAAGAAAAGYHPLRATNEVASVRYDWHDAARDRDVPVKIYFPKTGPGPFPVIIFSHGLGGSREGYEYLGEDWAAHGYVSVHVQHLGSDDSIFKGMNLFHLKAAMEKAMHDPTNTVNRARDVSFAIDEVEKLNQGNPLFRGRLDLNRIGMAGHSFGAGTTLVVAGEKTGLGNLEDGRIKAALAMSPPVLAGATLDFSGVRIPVFVMTGTEDVGFTRVDERRLAFDRITSAGTCIVTFNGLDHMTFSGHVQFSERKKDKKFHPLICIASTAFWDAHLRGDTEAAAWLEQGGFTDRLGNDGKFELK
ncbi:MAG TPA: hypothetical protein VFV81_04235 [Verrucomicrobiae bacterium]|nr:hypothetical protein [Verrucomicrobiae bacterium]